MRTTLHPLYESFFNIAVLISSIAFRRSSSACCITPCRKMFLRSLFRSFSINNKLLSKVFFILLPGSAPANTVFSSNRGNIIAEAGQVRPQAGQLFLQASGFTTFKLFLSYEYTPNRQNRAHLPQREQTDSSITGNHAGTSSWETITLYFTSPFKI